MIRNGTSGQKNQPQNFRDHPQGDFAWCIRREAQLIVTHDDALQAPGNKTDESQGTT